MVYEKGEIIDLVIDGNHVGQVKVTNALVSSLMVETVRKSDEKVSLGRKASEDIVDKDRSFKHFLDQHGLS